MIELIGVSKNYGPLNILDQFSHVFAAGSKTAVTGASGIGKTTLLNVISGLTSIDAGLVRIEGQVTDTPSARVHPSARKLGFAFQFPSLWPHMTVRGNILYGLSGLSRQERESRLHSTAEAFQLSEILKKYPGEISGGQAKRVSLARTMIVDPQYLLLDEPLNNLDRELKDSVLEIIRNYGSQNNHTIIFVTHDQKEAEGLCDRVCCFDSKRLY